MHTTREPSRPQAANAAPAPPGHPPGHRPCPFSGRPPLRRRSVRRPAPRDPGGMELSIRAHPERLDAIDLEAWWLRLVDDGLAEHVFHDASVGDEDEFIAFAGAPGRAFYAVYSGGDPAALFWLDGRAGRSARIHFAVLREFFGSPARVIGFYVTDWLLSVTGSDGRPLIDVLVGVTPATNRAALAFVRDLGFTVLGEVPHAAPLTGGRSTGAVVSYLTRKED